MIKITYNAGRQNKIHILVDGEYFTTVDAEYWFTCKWWEKAELSDETEIEEFYKDTGSRYAFISGLRVLSYGDNSRKELRRKLITKGHKAEYVDAALDSLEEYGFVNDKRFAEVLASRLMRTKHMSAKGIKNEMLLKGISREIADEVLGEIEFDPVDDIVTLLQGKYKKYLYDEKGIKKTVAGLQRLGYNWSDIKSAMNKVDVDGEDDFND